MPLHPVTSPLPLKGQAAGDRLFPTASGHTPGADVALDRSILAAAEDGRSESAG
jgi:hypothetical protein